MHERTERALCRLAFLLLCAVPTLLTIALTLLTWTPWYHQRQLRGLEAALSQRLGVNVAITSLRRPTPSSWQLGGVQLTDPETGALVAQVREISYGRIRDAVVLHLSQPEVQSSQLPLVWRVIHDRFLCQPDLLGAKLRLHAQDLSIHSHPQGMTFSPVKVWIEPKADTTSALVHFSLAGWDESTVPATINVTRYRSGEKPHTEWVLQTGSKPIPCSALANYMPIMRRLGLDAEFSGLLRWRLEQDDYTVQLQQATFANVNMLELFEPLDYHVSGKGTIKLQSLTRHSGRPISEATGQLAILGGRIEVGLLRKLASVLQAQLLPLDAPDNERLECQIIATEFQLYGNDVQVRGICSQQRNFEASQLGTAIVAWDRPILTFDPTQRIPSNALTSALDPNGQAGIQLGPEPNWARNLLPQLGRDSESSQAEAAPRVGRLRLKQ